MLSRVSQTAQRLLPLAVRTGITRFYSTSSVSSQVISNISDFNPDNTRQALIHVHESEILKQKVDLNNLLVLDSISETSSSITKRAFDHTTKQFLAVKTLRLDSAREWNEVNLALRQYSFVKPTLGKVFGMDYNEQRQEVKIFSELGKTTLGDYCYFRTRNEKSWTNPELRLLYWNMVNQLNTLRELGGECEAIKPRNLFYDTNANILKLFDLSDFDTIQGVQGFSLDEKIPINIESVIYSLVQVINPYAPMYNSEEARAYLRANHPEFLDELKYFETETKKWQSQPAEVARKQIGFHLKLPEREWFLRESDYERFLFKKMDQVWGDVELPKSSKEWASLNQGLGNYIEAIYTLEQCLNKTLDNQSKKSENRNQIYAELADAYRAAKLFDKASHYFQKARQIAESSSERDKLILAQIYNSYGKSFIDQKHYYAADVYLSMAEVHLKGSPKESTFLATEIKSNIKFVRDMQEKEKNSQHTQTKIPNSSSNSNEETEKESWFSIWKIFKIVIFVKVACMALNELQEDIRGVIPEYLLKDKEGTITESSQTKSTTLNNDHLPEKPVSKPAVQLNSNFSKNEDKPLGVGANEDVSVTGESQGSYKGSFLFGAFLVFSTFGLTL